MCIFGERFIVCQGPVLWFIRINYKSVAMIIVLHGLTCCQLHFAPLCLLWEHMLVWDILHQTGQQTFPEPQCLIPKTSDQSFRYCIILHFPVTHTFWPCSDNSDTFFSPPSLGYISSFFFFRQRGWSSTLCFSNEAFDLSFRGLLFQSLLQEA